MIEPQEQAQCGADKKDGSYFLGSVSIKRIPQACHQGVT